MGDVMAVRQVLTTRTLRVAAVGAVLVALSAPAYADDPKVPPSSLPPASVTKLPTSRSLEQLQAEAAKLQAEFATATIKYTTGLKKAQQAKAAADTADVKLGTARRTADAARTRLGRLTAQAYQLGISAIAVAATNQAVAYQQSVAADAAATTAATDSTTKRNTANLTATEAQRLADEVRKKSAAAAAKMQDWLGQMELATAVSGNLQKSRDSAALARWKAYLAELTAAHITPPKASALRNPAKLPKGLQRLTDSSGKTIAGTAQTARSGRAVRVLSAETIRAVNRAFGLLGHPYGAGATGPAAFGCLGAARASWSPYAKLPKQIDAVYRSYQAVPGAGAQPGDLLVMGNKRVGLFHIGVAIGDGEMIAADEGKGAVIVTSVPENVYGVVRPTLGQPKGKQTAPVTSDTAAVFRCGQIQETFSVGTGGSWTWPLPDGTYTIGTSFGQPGSLWATGVHTGQDFPAAVGTPVRAVAAGTAYVEHPAWAGNLVRIDHGDGTETLYGHLSATTVTNGQQVQPGQQIGNVGALGNATGPHLHFEVRLGGQAVNPMPFLATGSGTLGWGGLTNGLIPGDKLCSLGVGNHALRCDAATAYVQLSNAFAQRFGHQVCITDSYRSYAQQVALYAQKPSLAALPGTSNHGWGLAVDLCGGVQKFGSTEHRWMKANAGRFGWVHPRWAEPGGSRPEPWHWEFGNLT